MADSNINDLHPDLKPIAEAFLAKYASTYPDRHPAKITVTWRSPQDQQRAYDAGLSAAKPGHSKHEFMLDGKPAAKAFDFAVFDESGNYIADGTDDWYTQAGSIGKGLGLTWGGDFISFPDYDHLELPT